MRVRKTIMGYVGRKATEAAVKVVWGGLVVVEAGFAVYRWARKVADGSPEVQA